MMAVVSDWNHVSYTAENQVRTLFITATRYQKGGGFSILGCILCKQNISGDVSEFMTIPK